jgi:hypothetical protein
MGLERSKKTQLTRSLIKVIEGEMFEKRKRPDGGVVRSAEIRKVRKEFAFKACTTMSRAMLLDSMITLSITNSSQ